MTPEDTTILKLAQSIYLAKNNKYNDVDGDEQLDFIEQTIDWVNQFIEELEEEADWNYVTSPRMELGTVLSAGTASFALPDDVNRLVVSPYRDLVIKHDGSVVSTFKLVKPNQIADPSDPEVADRATVVGRNVIFSRPFKEHEVGGKVEADAVLYIPRLAHDNVEMLDLVKPKQLIILGVAKNATLPDIVQGGISPSLTQKYADLLDKALKKNSATSDVSMMPREDFSYIGGVGF